MGTRLPLALLAVAFLALGAGAALGGATRSPQDFPSCGVVESRNTSVTPAQRRVTRCLVDGARRGRRVRAVVVRATIEGSPIVYYVFVVRRRDVIVLEDATRDPFGGNLFTRLRCTRLFARGDLPAWSGCRTVGAGPPPWLVPYEPSFG
jgi:hypothetical protein